MEWRIEGKLAQTVRLTLEKDETVWASKGSLMVYDSGVSWSLKVPGGLSGAGRRVLSGESISLTLIESTREGSEVVLASNQPGKIAEWSLEQGAILTTRGSFVAAGGPRVEIDIEVAKRAGAALFGGAGLFLQKLSGEGTAFIHGAGDFMEYDLQPGQSVAVSTGNLAAFTESIDYDIQRVAGLRRMFFGGEGLFMTRLRGPGRVWLQSLKRNSGQGSKQS